MYNIGCDKPFKEVLQSLHIPEEYGSGQVILATPFLLQNVIRCGHRVSENSDSPPQFLLHRNHVADVGWVHSAIRVRLTMPIFVTHIMYGVNRIRLLNKLIISLYRMFTFR